MRRIGFGIALASLFLTAIGLTWTVSRDLALREVAPNADPPVVMDTPVAEDEPAEGEDWLSAVGLLILFPGTLLAFVALMILADNAPELIELWKIRWSKGDGESK